MDSFTNKNILKDNMNNGFLNERDSRRGLFDEMKRVEEESLVSTKETLGLILESEKIGVKTGRELVRQRETLNRVEDKLVSIDGSLDETQKHLKSIKSVFGGFRELFSKKKSINNNINKNMGIERLKQLSLGLGNEIDSQNSLIDRISKQTEKAEIRVKEQNQQMTRILRK
ncbi:unnamed protein product, partial [Medioppia subpectinata]